MKDNMKVADLSVCSTMSW